jgi:hypothetical protein
METDLDYLARQIEKAREVMAKRLHALKANSVPVLAELQAMHDAEGLLRSLENRERY